MKLNRIISRIRFYSLKFIISQLVYFDHRLYMKLYVSLLRRNGFILKGTPRFIAKSARFDDFDKIELGDRVVISMNVYFLTHDYSYTTGLIAIGQMPETDIGIVRGISVGNNVFIGMNSIILPGSKIGNNVIIGAGSVIRGVIQDNSIVAGNPAVLIGRVDEFALKVKSRNEQQINIDKN